MNQEQFLQEAKPMMRVVDSMFSKLFAPEPLLVELEGIEWCVTGRYEREETPCGEVGMYRIESVWLSSDTERNDLKDYLKFITLSNLGELATEKYEAKARIEQEASKERE